MNTAELLEKYRFEIFKAVQDPGHYRELLSYFFGTDHEVIIPENQPIDNVMFIDLYYKRPPDVDNITLNFVRIEGAIDGTGPAA